MCFPEIVCYIDYVASLSASSLAKMQASHFENCCHVCFVKAFFLGCSSLILRERVCSGKWEVFPCIERVLARAAGEEKYRKRSSESFKIIYLRIPPGDNYNDENWGEEKPYIVDTMQYHSLERFFFLTHS